MAAMILGTYTFDWQPDKWTIPAEKRIIAKKETYESVVFFSFGTTIIGKEILLEWDWVPETQFDSLNALYLSDTEQSWQPGNGGIYFVEIMDFVGEHFPTVDIDFAYRQQVKMLLTIKECTVEPT